MPSFTQKLSEKLGGKDKRDSTNDTSSPPPSVSVDKRDQPSTFAAVRGTPASSAPTSNRRGAPGSSIEASLQQTKFVDTSTSSKGIAHPNATPTPAATDVHQNTVPDDSPPPTRLDVESTFSEFASLIHASNRPLPTQSGDGQYLEAEKATGFWSDLTSLGLKDFNTVREIMVDKAKGAPQDDKKMHMEHIIQLVAALPTKSANRAELTHLFLDELWNSLQHPPLSYMSDDWKYRCADGRNNSYIFPMLGAANTPFARSVNPRMVQPAALPDPALIFDSILAREEFKPNPNRISTIFFSWASLIIHDIFQTDHKDFATSKTSSYLDLSILYGDTQDEQDQIRTFKDGKLKPDCFTEERLLAFPPSCGVMLIMLNRYHNYVVENLATINEGGRFSKPVESERMKGEALKAAWKKHDNDLFQTGRLVTCGLYINITIYDYLRTIVNLNRTNSTWTLDPRLDRNKAFSQKGTPQGIGNQVSAEFSLSYRWHSCIGEIDEQWTELVYKELFGKPSNEVSIEELMVGLGKYDHDLPADPFERPFAHLKRGPDGKFDDADLAKIFTTGVEQVAGCFGARNIPKALKAITILGIKQCRAWNLCTLNEYRKFFGLKTYDTFLEVNSDPYVAEQLKHLYEHPDFIELYPGLAIEDYKNPMVPGVGICPTHTISRVVLSDAVALVRGDRFYTLDWSPKHMTNWGFNEINADLSFQHGCVFYKLLLGALPNHFQSNSIYAHYPMTVPDENVKIMKDLGRFQDYDYTRPVVTPNRVNVSSYQSAQELCADSTKFSVVWGVGLGGVLGKGGEKFCLGGDSIFHQKQKETMRELIYRDNWHSHVKHFYEFITLRLLHQHTVKIANINQVDITRDVGNLAHVHFAANMFDLPLKSVDNPKGIFSEQELWMAMSVLFTAVFFDFVPSKSLPLRKIAQKLSNMIGKLIELNIKTVTATSFASRFFDSKRENENPLSQYGIHMIRHLHETGMSPHDMVYSQILPTAVSMVPNQSQVITQVLDYYLNEGKQYWPDIQKWANVETPESDEKLMAYVNEGTRINGTFGTYRKAEVEHTFQEGDKQIHVKPGDKILCNFGKANKQAEIFPEPDTVRLDRPEDSYIHYGIGEHMCLGKQASLVGLTAMLRTIAKLKNLRPASGPQGKLKKIPLEGGSYVYMREDQTSYFVFPCTFKVWFDGELPPMIAAHRED